MVDKNKLYSCWKSALCMPSNGCPCCQKEKKTYVKKSLCSYVLLLCWINGHRGAAASRYGREYLMALNKKKWRGNIRCIQWCYEFTQARRERGIIWPRGEESEQYTTAPQEPAVRTTTFTSPSPETGQARLGINI